MPEAASINSELTTQRVRHWLQWGQSTLNGRVDRPLLEAQILLSCATGHDRLWLMAHPDAAIDAGTYPDWIAHRHEGEPLEYLTGRAGFYSREFEIVPGVLIPRPETELLIDRALEAIAAIKSPKVIEIGTGSGVIAIMLALLRPDLAITATDINPKAIALAQKNAARFGVSERISFIQTSLLDGVSLKPDLLISNPPYIATDAPLKEPVLREPHEALFGGRRGDELLRAIIDLACTRQIGLLACECGYDQREVLEAYLKRKSVKQIEFYTDYAGLQRGFVARIDD